MGPGGKFEAGESPEECPAGRSGEETGLTMLDWEYRGIVTFVSDLWGHRVHAPVLERPV